MIVYGSSLSPYVRKVLAFAGEKGIELECVPFRPTKRPPEFVEASPFGKMPAFRHGDFTLCDSSAIIHYLDALRPEPELIPAEAKARGRTIWYEEFADTILIAAAAKIFVNRIVAPRFQGREGDLEAADKAESEELPPLFDYVERQLPESGHLVGDQLTLADIAVASSLANLRHLGIHPDQTRYPKLTAFGDAMLTRPSFNRWLAQETKILQMA